MSKRFFIFSFFIITSHLEAQTKYSIRGSLSSKIGRYTYGKQNEKTQQAHWAEIEQESQITPKLMVLNQLRWKYNSIYQDLTENQISDSRENRRIFLGDNFIQFSASSWVIKTGYQEIAWGEAFGFNYADIVNPKDLKETFYSDYSKSRLPLFLVNFKYFFDEGSLQLIYSPEPRFSEALPVNLFTQETLPQTKIASSREKNLPFFDYNEWGGKISKSLFNFDTSFYYYNFLDRDPHYILQSASLNLIALQEKHNRINTTGFSLAKTLWEDYVFRIDLVYTKNKIINNINNFTLSSTQTNNSNLLMSLDTPTFNKFSAVFIFAYSRLEKNISNSFRNQNQSYTIAKFFYDLGENKKIDLSYTHDFTNNGHALQNLLSWPVNNSLDLEIGSEIYWGEKGSELYKIRKLSKVFLGIKNYFQL